MSAHTPGPWRVEPDRRANGNYQIRADIPGQTGALYVAQTIGGLRDGAEAANAHLIAAAPDLLAKLKFCLCLIDNEHGWKDGIRAVIYRAEGRS